MKKIIFILLIILSAPAFTYSKSITKNQALLAGKNFYFEHINYYRPTDFKTIHIDQIYEKKTGSTILYYVINFSYQGFIVVSGDDRITPVLCYGYESRYSELEQPPAFRLWMLDYEKQIKIIIDNDLQPRPSVADEWLRLSANDPSKLLLKNDFKQVMPLVKTTWDQGKYYNNLCPIASGGPDGRCWAGCVPTAMGQIMNYYRYPSQGVGSYTYVHPDYGTQTADFANTNYAWDKMPLEVTERQNDSAVATLLYHLGVSVDLDYGPDGSGMFNHKAAFALKTNFKYSPDCEYIFRDTATHTNWKQLIFDHLDQKKPLYYAGWADTINVSGHAFVCDGYQDTTYFHFNWGWGGSYNGYFMIDNLIPGGNDFTLDHEMILNFYPDSSADYPAVCPANEILNRTKGTLSDGSGPLYKYRNNSDCQWLIQPNDSVTSIKLTFLEFKTEADSDKVIVYNGSTIASPVLGIFSGTNVPAPIITSGKTLLVRFISNDNISDDGWLASYETTSPVFCSGIKTYTTASGNFSDGSGNFVYHPNELCRWSIQPAGATGIQLHFDAFDIGVGDYLKVTDAGNNQELANLTGSVIPADITCYSGNMLLLFKSYDKDLSQGFSANYFTASALEETDQAEPLITVFPNPAQTTISLNMVNPKQGNYSFSIYSPDGRLLLSESFSAKAGSIIRNIDISALPSGMYLLSISGETNTKFIKFIKE